MEETFLELGVEEEGHDINEVDALDGEVREPPESAIQGYLCTGEFGGGGGGGGGLSSLGILASGGVGGVGGGRGMGNAGTGLF